MRSAPKVLAYGVSTFLEIVIVVLVVTSLAAIAALGSLGSRKPNSAFENSQAPYLMGSATDHGLG